jgi:hypothetical protein
MKASTVISYAVVAAAGIALGVAIADTKAGKAIDNGIEKAKTKLGLTREDRKSSTEEKRSESGERRE